MWRKLIVWLFGHLSLFAMRFIYGPWSRFYRWAFERKYNELPKDFPWTTKKIMDFFRKCTWTKDKWYMGWDVMSKPQRLFMTKRGDCDEFATFASEALSGDTKWVLSVTWYHPGGKKKFAGHNVCIYLHRWRWWHMSNWGKIGPYKYMYDLIDSIPPEGAIGCAWSLRPARARKPGEKDLKFVFGGRFKHKTSRVNNGRKRQEGRREGSETL